MPSRRRSGLALSALLGALSLAFATPTAAQPLVVYDDELRSEFENWSWAVHDLAQSGVVHSGATAISFEPDGWAGIFFHRSLGIDPAEHEALELWVHGGAAGGQSVTVGLVLGGDALGEAPLGGFLAGGAIPAGTWAKATVPFAALGVTAPFDGLWLRDASGANQATVYVDDLVLLPNDTPPPPPEPVAVAVDPGADVRPVNPWIFGVSFGSHEDGGATRRRATPGSTTSATARATGSSTTSRTPTPTRPRCLRARPPTASSPRHAPPGGSRS